MNPLNVLPLMLVPAVLLATTANEPVTTEGQMVSVELYPTSAMVTRIVDIDLKAVSGQPFVVTHLPNSKSYVREFNVSYPESLTLISDEF